MTEIHSLQNAANNISDLKVVEYIFEDKRKRTKKYYLLLDGTVISPTLDYENMNHFILGLIKGREIYK